MTRRPKNLQKLRVFFVEKKRANQLRRENSQNFAICRVFFAISHKKIVLRPAQFVIFAFFFH